MFTCDWPVNYSAVPGGDPWDDEEQRRTFEDMAVRLMWHWTGQRLGVCREMIRPDRRPWRRYRPSTFDGRGPVRTSNRLGPWEPVVLSGGTWGDVGCLTCPIAGCVCGQTTGLIIPGPVQEIEEVLIDGTALDPSAYRVDNHRVLVRTDGETWPNTQDMSADPQTDPDTFQIIYQRGTPVPMGGQVAAGLLAYELHLAAKDDPHCGLPQRVQTVTRQGVTVAVLDQFDDVEQGHTGIWLIDSWVASLMHSPQRATVRSPDIPVVLNRRQTWPTP